MRERSSRRIAITIALFCFAAVVASPAQTFNTIFTFNGFNGDGPLAPLTQGTNGKFYGTSQGGSPNRGGTVFELTPSGEMPMRYGFCALTNCDDGRQPVASVIQAANGSFVGVTTEGGNGSFCFSSNTCGTFFEITAAGQLNTLYNFCSQVNCGDGYSPASTPVEANGNFYGADAFGGADSAGLIYEIAADGTFSIRYTFCSQTNCADGSGPSGLVRGANGNFFGSTNFFGKNGSGTIFEITSSGQLTTLYNFTGFSGDVGGANLIQASNGNLYGTTLNFANFVGEIFELTKTGKFVILYTFCCQAQLSDPVGLIQASDENFYGIANQGGANFNGGIFKMTPSGKVSTYINFPSCQFTCADGFNPTGLMQATDGNFYGVMDAGGLGNCFGRAGCGTVYKVTTGLPPFVALQPNYGKVGSNVKILGNNLTGTAGVTFNGTPAAFTVVSDTYIKATVPPAATTGTLEVVTSSGTLQQGAFPGYTVVQKRIWTKPLRGRGRCIVIR